MMERQGFAHLEIRNVSRAFVRGRQRVQALGDVNLSVRGSEVVVILGPSGCGKTTLLRLVAGLTPPDTGRILIGGQPPRPGRDSAMVFQSFRLLPWKTTRQNVAFALSHLPRAERAARADHYLSLVGLARFAASWPSELSGGMRQRLALARALAAEAPMLLMDEPFASLDAQTRELMQQELLRLLTLRPATVLFVTHSVDEALFLADRVVLLSPRPGRVVETVDLPFGRSRRDAGADPRDDPDFPLIRRHLWERLRAMVLDDPTSDFFGRDPRGGA
ncbi:ABC transporter ATP-binding protein [Halodurantibacterium flavum]|uniref:ABC transporter ATP-binding protein n=1 Tax=Halodurantibacterium flavum TaxID=1382802 RepID=A0ABW4SA67_9RHOB